MFLSSPFRELALSLMTLLLCFSCLGLRIFVSLLLYHSCIFLQRFQEWLGSNSELTPSETVETFEDDESEVR